MAIQYLDAKRLRGSSTAGATDTLGTAGNATSNDAELITSGHKLGTGCLDFDGSEKIVATGLINAMDTTGSISMWFNTDTDEDAIVFSICDANANTKIEIKTKVARKFGINTKVSGTTQWEVETSTLYNAATNWNHVVITHNGTIGKIYLNGSEASYSWAGGEENQEDKTVWWTAVRSAGGDGVAIGSKAPLNNSSWNEFFEGKIDDIGIWNRALTSDEVAKLYNNNGTDGSLPQLCSTIPSGLKVYYSCDSATVTNEAVVVDEKATLVNSSNESFTASSSGQTWTQTNSTIAISGTTITATNALDNGTPAARVTAPLGITLSDDDWVIDFEFSYTGSANNMFPILVSSTADKVLANSIDWVSLAGSGTSATKIAIANAGSGNSGSYSSGSITTSTGTTYYCRMIRSDDDFTLKMYSTEALRTAEGTAVGTVTQSTPTGITGLTYMQSSARDDGGGGSNSWVVDNVKIYNGVAVAGVISSAYSNLPENTLFDETDTYKTYWLQSNAWKLPVWESYSAENDNDTTNSTSICSTRDQLGLRIVANSPLIGRVVSSVTFKIAKVGSPVTNNVFAKIYSDASNASAADDLEATSTNTYVVSSISNGDEVTFNFDTTYALEENSAIMFGLDSTSGSTCDSATGYITFRYTSGDYNDTDFRYTQINGGTPTFEDGNTGVSIWVKID